MTKKPIRHDNHIKEELSERFFKNKLPSDWTAYRPQNDYGVDLIVEIFENNQATGLEFLVQLKSSNTKSDTDTETISLKTTTDNFLWDKTQVVLLVKYVISENQAYWILLSSVPSPNQDQDTYIVHIPKVNTLPSENWQLIKNYVQQVTNKKLAVRKTR